ncbi:hypothetical protein V1505DRAFT_416939 [Lipomyces doorenjongii]
MSTAPTSTSIPIQEFRVKVQEAVEARGASYRSIKTFIFRFEDDATGADQDAIILSGCMQDVFAIDDVEDFAIEKTSRFPGMEIHERIVANARQLILARSLLIIAYICHAIIDMESNQLQLISENGTQKMFWSMIHDLCLTSTDDSIQNLVTGFVGGNRSIQLLAGCNGRSTVRSRKDGVTFIQPFRRAAYALRDAGNISFNVESLFGELQRSKTATTPDVVHKIIGNARPLVLPLKQGSSTTLRQSLSSSIETNFTLENAYESNSVILLCRASWETFARLGSTLDSVFVPSVKGPSLVHF